MFFVCVVVLFVLHQRALHPVVRGVALSYVACPGQSGFQEAQANGGRGPPPARLLIW